MIITLILLLLIIIIAILAKPHRTSPNCCKHCRYRDRNITQDPCIVCEDGSEYVKSALDGQEDFNDEA